MADTATAIREPAETISAQLRIAAVSYLNTLPLIEGLSRLAGCDLILSAPSRLAVMLERGEADVALCPIIDAVRSQVPFSLLRCGMIASDGPTMTVRIFSTVALDRIRTLHADTDSHTSVALARIILQHRFGIAPEIVDFDARQHLADGVARDAQSDHWPESMLLIGDKVVVSSPPPSRYPHQLDLGQAWKEWTGLPFVYALWMCRTDRLEDERVRLACRVLDHQLRRNSMRLDWIMTRRANEHSWPPELAYEYVADTLRYAVDERCAQAIERFFEECSRINIVSRVNCANWPSW